MSTHAPQARFAFWEERAQQRREQAEIEALRQECSDLRVQLHLALDAINEGRLGRAKRILKQALHT